MRRMVLFECKALTPGEWTPDWLGCGQLIEADTPKEAMRKFLAELEGTHPDLFPKLSERSVSRWEPTIKPISKLRSP